MPDTGPFVNQNRKMNVIGIIVAIYNCTPRVILARSMKIASRYKSRFARSIACAVLAVMISGLGTRTTAQSLKVDSSPSAVGGQPALTVVERQPEAPTLSAASGMNDASEFEQKAIDALDLMESGHLDESADVVNALYRCAPGSPIANQLRGTLELWIGEIALSRADFRRASLIEPDDPPTYLGLALCSLQSDGSDVDRNLAKAEACRELTTAEAQDIATLGAYHLFVDGRSVNPPDSSDDEAHEARDELAAMAVAHHDAHAGISALARFLATSSGVPRVTEDAGLRLSFSREPKGIFIAVGDPAIRSMYAARLAQRGPDIPIMVLGAGSAAGDPAQNRSMSGTVPLRLEGQLNPAAVAVRIHIDDNPPQALTAPPFTLTWDTRRVLNGMHTVVIEALTADGGIVNRQAQTVQVDNPPSEIAGTDRTNTMPEDFAAIEAEIWNDLTPRPSRAVAEAALARLDERIGRRDDAITHNLIASALDPRLAAMLHVNAGSGNGQLPTRATRWNGQVGVWYGPRTSRSVALTYDDGPDMQTNNLLDALDRAKAAATFFVIGSRAEKVPEVVRRMAAGGYEVENHSYTHPNISQCLPPMIESEILRTNVIIRSLTGHYPHFFRPPGGDANDTLAKLAATYNLKLAFWTVDGLKAEDAGSTAGLVSYVMKHVRPGAIILMHNGVDATVRAVPILTSALRARGYKLVTLNELVNR